MIPVFLLLAALVIDVGNWYTHKRQLQNRADAAAFAAGVEYAKNWQECVYDGPTRQARGEGTARRRSPTPRASTRAIPRRPTTPAPPAGTAQQYRDRDAVEPRRDDQLRQLAELHEQHGLHRRRRRRRRHRREPVLRASGRRHLLRPGTGRTSRSRSATSRRSSAGSGSRCRGTCARADRRPAGDQRQEFMPLAIPNNVITKVADPVLQRVRHQPIADHHARTSHRFQTRSRRPSRRRRRDPLGHAERRRPERRRRRASASTCTSRTTTRSMRGRATCRSASRSGSRAATRSTSTSRVRHSLRRSSRTASGDLSLDPRLGRRQRRTHSPLIKERDADGRLRSPGGRLLRPYTGCQTRRRANVQRTAQRSTSTAATAIRESTNFKVQVNGVDLVLPTASWATRTERGSRARSPLRPTTGAAGQSA